jgi:AraC family transcriptional regulator
MKPLPFGSFIGDRREAVDLNGFSLAEFVDRPEENIPRHSHENAHFFIVLKGFYRTTATGVGAICSPTTVIFNPAGTTHRDRFQTRGGRFLTLSVGPELIGRIGGRGALAEHAIGYSSGELPWLARRLYRELRQRDELSPIVLEGLALELLADAVRERDRRAPSRELWLRSALQLIHDGYLEKLTVQGVARAVGVRPLVLSRSFRKAFGCSPGEMLRRRRVDRAEELLRRRGLPIAEIALASGFADQAQLTKAFRRITGSTPGRYRRLVSD